MKISTLSALFAMSLAFGCSKDDKKKADPAPAKTEPAKADPDNTAAKTATGPTATGPKAPATAKLLALKFHHDS